MRKEKLKLYIFEILIIIFLFFTLFASNIISKLFLSLIIAFLFIFSLFILKKKPKNQINEKKVLILMLIFGVLYVGIFYLMGLYYGYIDSKYPFTMSNFIKLVIPITITIITSELLREKLLCQDSKLEIRGRKIDISYLSIFIIMTLIDLSLYLGIYDLKKLDDFLLVLGFIFFASVSCNMLYNYISKRHGSMGIIVFRLITTLYLYLIPIVPNVYILMRTFLRMLTPLIIYLILEATFTKKNYAISSKNKRISAFWTSIVFAFIVIFIMLISCQFKYGIVVIGSESMTGSINKGDAIIFEKYNNKDLKKGQVIIFDYNNIKTVHRIVNIKKTNGEMRYFTKGDANKNDDTSYRTKKNISGVVKFKIKYIGLPTLWFRSLFK